MALLALSFVSRPKRSRVSPFDCAVVRIAIEYFVLGCGGSMLFQSYRVSVSQEYIPLSRPFD